jgi:CRISP-associated protein Cas1
MEQACLLSELSNKAVLLWWVNMETIFIDRRGTDISINAGRLRVTNAKHNIDTSLPLAQMRSVVICCECGLSSSMLRGLAKHDIALICFHPTDIDASFVSVPATQGNVQRRIAQYQLSQNTPLAQRIARLIVRLKIRQQRQMLQTSIAMRPEKRTELYRAMSGMPSQIGSNLSISQLMGIEGSAAKAYFSGLTHLFAPSLAFTGRNKRPPRDPVNAMLSLSYTLIYFEAKRALLATGLDPMLGFLHQASYGRDSLACDLAELMRAKVDRYVQQLFALQTLRSHHFALQENGGCYLNKPGRTVFFEHLMLVMPSWRNQLRRYARTMAYYIDHYTA